MTIDDFCPGYNELTFGFPRYPYDGEGDLRPGLRELFDDVNDRSTFAPLTEPLRSGRNDIGEAERR